MNFLLTHTVFFRYNIWHALAILFFLIVLIVSWIKIRKLKKIKADLEHEVSSAGAEVALEATPDEISRDEVNIARDEVRREQMSV